MLTHVPWHGSAAELRVQFWSPNYFKLSSGLAGNLRTLTAGPRTLSQDLEFTYLATARIPARARIAAVARTTEHEELSCYRNPN